MDKKQKIIYIILLFVIAIILFFVFTFLLSDKNEDYNYEHLIGKSFIANDNSYLVLNKDKTFYWYKDIDNRDEYYYGTYSIYRGENAIKYISTTLSIYGISEQYQRDYLENKDNNNKIDYYYNLNLNNEKLVTGETEEKLYKETRYYGLASDDYKRFDLINMDANNYAIFTLDEN